MRAPWEDLEPASRDRVERHRSALSRLESLTDFVFALSLVVLIARADAPCLAAPPSDQGLWNALTDAAPQLYWYAVCIVFLLAYWVLHHFQFRYLARPSGRLVWLTAVLIVAAALLPVTSLLLATSFIATAPVLLFQGNLLVIHLSLAFTWRHAVAAGLMFGGDVPSGIVRRMRTALRLGAAYIIITMGLAFVEPYASINVLLGLGVFYVVLTARGGYTLDILRRSPSSQE